jgi:ABC-type sugar transport system ATPase subunit
MNMFEGAFRPRGTGYRFEGKALTMSLENVAGGDGFPDRVVLGIRPEHLRLSAREDEDSFTMEVELVEPLGAELYVHGRLGDRPVVARLSPDHAVAPGATLRLAPDLAQLQFFDASSGVTLSHAPPSRPLPTGIAA